MVRTLAGEEEAFATLIDRYKDRVFRLLSRYTRDAMECEDIAQEVFLKVYRKLHTFQQDSAFFTWLYRIAVNIAKRRFRRRRRRERHPEPEARPGGAGLPQDIVTDLDYNARGQRIRATIEAYDNFTLLIREGVRAVAALKERFPRLPVVAGHRAARPTAWQAI